MAYKQKIKVVLFTDFYMDTVTYRGCETVELALDSNEVMSENQLLTCAIASWIFHMDKKHNGLGMITIRNYKVREYITETTKKKEKPILVIGNKKVGDYFSSFEQVKDSLIRKGKLDANISDEDLLNILIMKSNGFRPQNYAYFAS